MFSYVNFEMPCPHCGVSVTGFQTKDGECNLDTVQPHEVLRFYSGCAKCESWIDCEYIPPQGVGKIVAKAHLYKKNEKGGEVRDKSTSKMVEIRWDKDARKRPGNKRKR